MADRQSQLFNLTILFLFTTMAQSVLVIGQGGVADDDYACVYTIYIRTGSIFKGGTDSRISLSLYDRYGGVHEISDLESWGGLMGPGYDYFERGNLDIFTGRGRCLDGPVCAMQLSSDGSGKHHGWYCNYVEVTTTGPHIQCAQQQFTVEQWLALDTAPYELTAVRNYCGYDPAKKSSDGLDVKTDDAPNGVFSV